MIMATLLILSLLLVTVFVMVACKRRGELPESISAMVYDLPSKLRWLWTVWLVHVSALTMIPAIEVLDGKGMAMVAYFALVFLLLTAVNPLTGKDNEEVHMSLAKIAGLLTQVAVAFIDANWLACWLVFVFLYGSLYIQPQGWLAKAVNGKGVFIAEAVCYVSLIGSLFTNI